MPIRVSTNLILQSVLTISLAACAGHSGQPGVATHQRVSNEYTGDGGKIDELTSTTMIATSSDDALIVHVQVDVVDSSLVLIKQHEYTESWAKYERATGR